LSFQVKVPPLFTVAHFMLKNLCLLKIPNDQKLHYGDHIMEKGMALLVKIIGLFLSALGLAVFSFLIVAWSVEEYSHYSVPVWPMVFSIVIAVLGFVCVKAGMGGHSS